MIRRLTPEQALRLKYEWKRFWARRKQLEPSGAWLVWLLCSGRGFGKTRVGAEWVRDKVESGKAKRIALVGKTVADVRDVMIKGPSGILAISPPWFRPVYEPSKRLITWPNGAIATTYTAEEPVQLRGPAHDLAWADELAAWKYHETWFHLLVGLREGIDPRCVATTTPLPLKFLRELIAEPYVHTTYGSTFENADNLAASSLEPLRAKYLGTRLGRQELEGELLNDAPGALWQRDQLHALRVHKRDCECEKCPGNAVEIRTIVVAVDPATTSGEDSNETGIVVVGLGVNGHGYMLEDLSGRYSPHKWGEIVVDAYARWRANRIVAEANQGGDLVKSNITTIATARRIVLSVTTVHAARAKRTRAEPIAALTEQGRIHHIGHFSDLENQLCEWQPEVVLQDGPKKKIGKSDSPDRLDAYVWGFTDLMVDRNPNRGRSRVRVGNAGVSVDEMSGGYA